MVSELDYWIEKIDDQNDCADVWVEVDKVNPFGSHVYIYLYYGNSEVTTTSDGASTFIEFDGLEDYNIDKRLPFGKFAAIDVTETVKIDDHAWDGVRSIRYSDRESNGCNKFKWDIENLEDGKYRFHMAAKIEEYADEHAKIFCLYDENNERKTNVRNNNVNLQTPVETPPHWHTIATITPTQWHTFEFCIPMDTSGDVMNVKIDDTWYNEQPIEQTVDSIDYWFHAATGIPKKAKGWFDSYFVAQYFDPEPSVSEISSEQSCPT